MNVYLCHLLFAVSFVANEYIDQEIFLNSKASSIWAEALMNL